MEKNDQKFLEFLKQLDANGKIKSISNEDSKQIFERISEQLEPLNFDSRLKQAASEESARHRFFNT